MTQIPIYRAKKKDSDEYVIGYYSSAYDTHHYIIDHLGVNTKTSTVYMSTNLYEIDKSTLAIHFPGSINTNSEKVWYNLEEISNIIKDYENGKVETN